MTQLKPFSELVSLTNKELEARIEEKVNGYLDRVAKSLNDTLLTNALSGKATNYVQIDISEIYKELLKEDTKVIQLFNHKIVVLQYYIEERTLLVYPPLPGKLDPIQRRKYSVSEDDRRVEKWREGSAYYLHTKLPS